ncbi:MAG: DUF1553 domain-containing protein, partial [Armatimonadetes bacterium]|nr:DUF1553 domain-containing protein [Armatimonadota bacterium]
NGRLSRTLVNRIWARLLGRGFVEPVDEMDRRPWDPDLLDWLAADFAAHGYDVKRLLRQIVTSKAYQLPSVPLPAEQVTSFQFRGPVPKRLTAEQFADAVSELTGVWPPPAGGAPLRIPPDTGDDPWVRFRSGVLRSGSAEVEVDVSGAAFLTLLVTDGGDGGANDWADWGEPRLVLEEGSGTREMPLGSLKWLSASSGFGPVQVDRNVGRRALRLGSRTFPRGLGVHADSLVVYALPPGARRFRTTVGPDAEAVSQPGSRASVEFLVAAGARPWFQGRAALAVADSLTRALGRPNREQIVSQRAAAATTLQALELTNGPTLVQYLAEGSAAWLRGAPEATAAAGKPAGSELVLRLYQRALSRPPTAAEREAARALLSDPVRREEVEDLLWAVLMLPEFQLIR